MNIGKWFKLRFKYILSLGILGLVIIFLSIQHVVLFFPANWDLNYMLNVVSLFFLLIGLGLILCSVVLSILFFKSSNLQQGDKPAEFTLNNSHSDTTQRNRLDATLQALTPVPQDNDNYTKFSILGRFYHLHFPFWKKTLPPSYVLIIGIIITGLTEFLYSILYPGAHHWQTYIVFILPVFIIIPLFIILPFVFLSAGQELTNSWGLTYFSLPTSRKSFILGRFYCLNAFFLLLLLGIPVLISNILELFTYKSFFPSLSQYSSLPSNWVYPANFDYLGYTIFFILSLLWYLVFLFVMEMFFGFLLVYFRSKTLSLGLFYLSLLVVFFLPLIWGTKSPLVFFSSFFPSFLVQIVFPIYLSDFQVYCGASLSASCISSFHISSPLFSPLVGSLILLLSMVFLIGFLLLISFAMITRLKHLELALR